MAAVHSIAVASSSTVLSSPGVVGIRCQLSRSKHQREVAGRRRTRRAVAGGGLLKIRAETPEKKGGDGGGEDDFDARLAKLQRKVTSGTGKKAEVRKAKKEGGDMYASSTKAKGESLFIPPVPLNEPMSDGLVVELGFTPYTERLNGRLAALGLAALLLVELATGDCFVKFHDSGTLFVQVYTVVGLAAMFVKYEKERISEWPKA